MLLSISVDFRHADVSTRERFHPSVEQLSKLYDTSRSRPGAELAMVATCNRSELYAWHTDGDPDGACQTLAHRWATRPSEARALLAAAKRREGTDAARHLLRVAAGLESQVLGDGQILGQIRGAYRLAAETGAAGPVLHRLFDTALRTGKCVQSETAISLGRNSVGAEAAALAAHRFGTLTHSRVVVVGSGTTGERAARQLVKLGARDVILVNRTADRAAALAAEVRARSAPYETLHCQIAMADIAVVATGADAPVVNAGLLATARTNCGTAGSPLLVIDLAMPRNVEPAVRDLPGVTVVDLDTLHVPIAAAEEARLTAVPAAQAIVESELRNFNEWLGGAAARDAIRPLREALTTICRREIAFAVGEEAADRTTDRIVAKLLARPMDALRQATAEGRSTDTLAAALAELFHDRRATPRAPARASGDRTPTDHLTRESRP
jgi:glutamyl-tRNA reductase